MASWRTKGSTLRVLAVSVVLTFFGTPLAWAAPARAAEPAAGGATARPNILLVSLDTLRVDGLHVYGAPYETPHIDAVARGGLVFTNFFAHSSWTRPSFGSLLTSLYPSQHLAERNASLGVNRKLDDRFLTMAEILKKAGYTTAAFSGNVNVDPVYGFDQGFDFYRGTALRPKSATLPYPTGDEVYASFEGWFRQNKHRRFFAWVNLMDAHMPYAAPEKYRQGLVDSRYGGPVKAPFANADLAKRPGLTDGDKRQVRALYEAGVRYEDEIVGKIVSLLERAGVGDETLVVITSDHGEEFWEHAGFEHGHTLYDELIHVPLVMKYPKAFGVTGKVTKVTPIVRQVDFLPTVLDIAGIPAPGDARFEGVSVKTALLGKSIPEREVYSESLHYGAERKSIRTSKYKLVYHVSSGQIELYDLVKDRAEQVNVAASNPAVAKALMGRLQRWLERVKQSETAKKSSQAAAPDERTKELLKALGY